jgi:ribosomal protein L37AE/L43A
VYKKICSRCIRPSYSSAETGEWLCPACKLDLTERPFYNPSNYQNINRKVLPLKRKLEKYNSYISL